MPARLLALDYGRTRIGVAASDALGITARPLEAIVCRVRGADPVAWRRTVVPALRALVAERGTERLLVGLPLNMDGTEGPMAVEARAFAAVLAEALGLPVDLEDERLTSDEAEEVLREAGLRPSERKRVRDSVAAAVLLRDRLARTDRDPCADPDPCADRDPDRDPDEDPRPDRD